MSNLEHLIENGLKAIEDGLDYQHWRWKMRDDVNWEDCDCNMSIDNLWEICQYVYYSYLPAKIDDCVSDNDDYGGLANQVDD